MAYDRVVDSAELDTKLTSVADAIRSKTGKTDGLTLEQMPGEIEGIETGGVSEQDILDSMANRTWPVGAIIINGTVESGVFSNNSKITSVVIYGDTRRAQSAFNNCSALKKVEMHRQRGGIDFAYGMFSNCKALEHVVWNIPSTQREIFSGDTALKRFEGGVYFTSISGAYGVFANCSALKHMVFRNLVTLNNTDHFGNTPIASGGSGANIYMPSNLIDEQRALTNWAVFDAYGTITWKALEDYTIDGTTTGEMDWAKIEAEEASS